MANMVKFNKYGISEDKKYILAIGKPSRNSDFRLLKEAGAGLWGKRVFKNYNPLSKKSGTLTWAIFWGKGVVPNKGTYEGGSAEGHIFGKDNDADFSCISGEDHSTSGAKLTAVSKVVKSSKSEADQLRLNGATVDLDTMGFTGGDGSTSSSTSCKEYTKGFDIEKPFKAYIQIDYGKIAKGKSYNPKGNTSTIYLDFTADSSGENKGFSGMTPVMVNNATRKINQNIYTCIQEAETDLDGLNDYYLKAVKLKYHSPNDEDLYEKDGSDNSSNKILLSAIGLNDRNLGSPKTFDSCGKSIHDNISSVVEESDYIIKMDYSDYRENDSMNFIYNPSNKPVFTLREDDQRFLGIDNIQYTPINNYFNSTYRVYKQSDNKGGSKYNYVNSRNPKGVFIYGEKEDVEVLNEGYSSSEAYYNARYHNEKFQSELVYSYDITFEGVPPIEIGDYVECILDNTNLSDTKQVKSLSYSLSDEDAVNIITKIGLDAISPDITYLQTIKNIRKNAQTKRTSYTKGAIFDTKNSPYVFNGT
jgi:hypothetical protein